MRVYLFMFGDVMQIRMPELLQQQSTYLNNRTHLKAMGMSLIFLLLISCGSTPTQEQSLTPSLDKVISIEELPDYLLEAESEEEPKRSQIILNAARAMLHHGRYDWARNTLNQLNLYVISTQMKAEYYILHGLINVRSGDPYLAQHFLFSPELSTDLDELPLDLAIEARELRATLLFDLAEYQASIQERLALGLLLNADQDYLELNQDLIWQTLMELPTAKLKNESQQARDDVTQGWYSLAILAKNNQSNIQAQLRDIDKWILLWPEHPASLNLPADLQLLKQLAGHQAQRIAVLLPLTGRLATAASAIRDGILSSFYESTRQTNIAPNIQFYDTNNVDINFLYDQAVINGAELVIGPLSKSNIAILAKRKNLPVNTLALNNLNYGNNDNEKDNTDPNAQIYVNSPEVLITEESTEELTDTQNLDQEIASELITEQSSTLLNTQKSLYQFGLSVEEEVNQIAERAWRDGHRRAMIIVPDRAAGQRSADQFVQSWQAIGGDIVGNFRYANQREYSQLIESAVQVAQSKQRYREMRQTLGKSMEFEPRRRQDIDFIFLVSRPEEARQLKPILAFHYAGAIPVYATSDIFNGESETKANQDINGIRFTSLPWFFDEEGNEKKSIDAYTNSSPTYQQLYAFGVDAYRLYPRLEQLKKIKQSHFYGATGRLSVNDDNIIERQQVWAEFKLGRALILSDAKDESLQP